VDAGPCRFCGSTNRPGSRFCSRCGGRYLAPRPQAPLGPRYTSLRLQVDPLEPAPQRDIRWILIVLGIAFVVVGVLLLAVASIVSDAVSAGCSSSPCASLDPGPWFDWMGLPFLGLGIVLLAVGLWWAFR